MLYIDLENNFIGGVAKVKDIKKYGLIKASIRMMNTNLKEAKQDEI